jgi:type II secretory pathway pseudopilin PulG
LAFRGAALVHRRGLVIAEPRVMPTRSSDAEGGFSLVEVLVAATTLVVALSGLAQLLTMAAVVTRRAQSLTLAAVYAQEKLETLVPRAALDPALAASPARALTDNIDGYCDFLDRQGAVVGNGTTVPSDAVYVRRWAVQPMPATSGVAIALHVVVVDARRGGLDAHTRTVVRYVP